VERSPGHHLADVFKVALAGLLPLVAAAAGCGDPMLPSDYAGPPAGAVSGNVFAWAPTDKVAKFPLLSLEWLGALDVPVEVPVEAPRTILFSQSLRFVRSSRLENDWDIDLVVPEQSALLERTFAAGRFRFSVGKVVYFDDRTRDGRIDWTCGSGQIQTLGSCDVIKAVSTEYVVYLESAPACRARVGALTKPEMGRGFHYFRLEGGLPRELAPDEPIGFAITDRSPVDSDPTRQLRLFAESLLTMWRFDTLGDCQ
jgi:hypothetical protein